jgi:hypothetical protein
MRSPVAGERRRAVRVLGLGRTEMSASRQASSRWRPIVSMRLSIMVGVGFVVRHRARLKRATRLLVVTSCVAAASAGGVAATASDGVAAGPAMAVLGGDAFVTFTARSSEPRSATIDGKAAHLVRSGPVSSEVFQAFRPLGRMKPGGRYSVTITVCHASRCDVARYRLYLHRHLKRPG